MLLVVRIQLNAKRIRDKFSSFSFAFHFARSKTGTVVGWRYDTTKRYGFIKIEMAADGNYTRGRAIRSGRDSSGENGDICPFCAVRVPTL